MANEMALDNNVNPVVEEENLDALFKPVKINETESEHLAAEPYSYWKSVLRVFIKKPAARIAFICLVAIILCAIIIPLFAPYAPGFRFGDPDQMNKAPSLNHWWGTDVMGRDLFFGIFISLGKSMIMALIVSAIEIVVGTLVGLAWGFFRKLDPIMIEIYNLISNVPSLLLFMLLAVIFSTAFPDITKEGRFIIALSLFGWIGISLFIRNQTIIITNREYNIASKTLGTPSSRIMIKNLLPYLLSVIITELSLLIPGVVSSEVSMTYFGVGLDTKGFTIGALLENGRQYFTQYPWQLVVPSAMLAFIIFTFYLLGLALSDALDPKKHR